MYWWAHLILCNKIIYHILARSFICHCIVGPFLCVLPRSFSIIQNDLLFIYRIDILILFGRSFNCAPVRHNSVVCWKESYETKEKKSQRESEAGQLTGGVLELVSSHLVAGNFFSKWWYLKINIYRLVSIAYIIWTSITQSVRQWSVVGKMI